MSDWTNGGPVPADWRRRGVWLSRADVELATDKGVLKAFHAAKQELIELLAVELASNEYTLEEFEAAKKESTELLDGLTPEAFDAFVDMSKGDRTPPRRPPVPAFVAELELRAKLSDPKQQAYGQYQACKLRLEFDLAAKLECGELIAFGNKGHRGGPLEYIAVPDWQDFKIDKGRKDAVRGENIAFVSVMVIPRSCIALPTPGEHTAPLHDCPTPALHAQDDCTPTAQSGKRMKKKPTRPPEKKRGRRPIVTPVATQRMVDDIRAGKHTLHELGAMKQKVLAATYDVKSRDTVLRALAGAAKIVGNSNPGN